MVKEFNASFKGQELILIQKDNGKFIKPKIIKELEGSYAGSQLKPAVEVIIVCMKPLSEKTFTDQALKNGKGVTWLDNARIPFEENPTGVWGTSNENCKPTFNASVDQHEFRSSPHQQGRFPANLLVTDDVLNNGKITVSKGGIRHNKTPNMGRNKIYGDSGVAEGLGIEDKGSFSRYFDLDLWFEKQIEELPEEIRKTFPFLICPKASKSERNKGCENLEGEVRFSSENKSGSMLPSKISNLESHKIKGNAHPTVKPLKLMSYLVTLGSRKGDVILDPFLGSGTTALAAEILERNWIGIELYPEYCEIAKARLNGAEILFHKGETINTTTTIGTCKSKNCTFKDEKGNCSGNGLKLKCKDRK